MEGTFFYHHQLHDQVLDTPMIMPSQNNNFNIEEFMFGSLSDSSFPHCYMSEALAPCMNIASPDPASNNISTVIDAKSDSSSSMVIDISQIGVNHSPNDRRTRARDASPSRLTSSKGKDSNGRRRKKQKREEERTQKEEMKAKLEAQPEGYIHVRARRGQATDSHSLAERVRRKKLSERMTILQSLVPGCDKVIGKAPVLDVIINYVQSLQNQIEFLSMRLASMDGCMLSDHSFDHDGIGGMTYEQVQRGGFEQQNMDNISEPTNRDLDDCLIMMYSSSPSDLFQPQELDHTTTAFSQEVDSTTLGQFAEPGQGLLGHVAVDNIF